MEQTKILAGQFDILVFFEEVLFFHLNKLFITCNHFFLEMHFDRFQLSLAFQFETLAIIAEGSEGILIEKRSGRFLAFMIDKRT